MERPSIASIKELPFSKSCLAFGSLSIPLVLMRHLVSLALVMALLGIALGLFARYRIAKGPDRWSPASMTRVTWGLRTSLVGFVLSIVVWTLWVQAVLPF